jgi:hypothetical protein
MALKLRAVPQDNVIQLQIGGALDLNLHLAPPAETGYVLITAHYGTFSVTSEASKVAYTLSAGNKIGLQTKYVDKNGNPAVVDGDITWTSSDDALCAVAVDTTDSNKCLLSAPGSVGDAQVTAKADADLGDGVREIVLLLDVHVVAGEAVGGTIEPIGAQAPIDAPVTP